MKKLLLILFILLLSLSAFSRCGIHFTKAFELPGGRSVSELGEVKVGTYNVLNLEFSPGKYLDNPTTGKREFTPGTNDLFMVSQQ